MIDLHDALATNKKECKTAISILRRLIDGFNITGNCIVSDKLDIVCSIIDDCQLRMDNAYAAELNRFMQADSAAFKETVLAAFKRS